MEHNEDGSHPSQNNRTVVSPVAPRNVQIQGFFSGPLPPPSVLEGYERALPGSAEKILEMAMKEQQHRHTLEHAEQQEESAHIQRGQRFGVTVALATLAAAVLIVIYGDSVATGVIGSLLGVGGLATIAGAFIHVSRKQESTDEESTH